MIAILAAITLPVLVGWLYSLPETDVDEFVRATANGA